MCSLSCSSIKQEGLMNDKMDIYLVIGQSNMAGRAVIEKEHEGPIENVFLFNDRNDDQWEQAANPLNKYSTIRKNIGMQRLSPSYSFSKSMQESNPSRKIGIVVNAKGGSGIVQWMPGTHFYNEALRLTRKALKDGTLKGIIWHQGESDSDEIRRDMYLGRLEEMVNGFREAFHNPTLPFVLGEIYPTDTGVTFNKILNKAPSFIKNTAIVSSEGTSAADNLHFDARSAVLMGQRYAEKMIALQSQLESN